MHRPHAALAREIDEIIHVDHLGATTHAFRALLEAEGMFAEAQPGSS